MILMWKKLPAQCQQPGVMADVEEVGRYVIKPDPESGGQFRAWLNGRKTAYCGPRQAVIEAVEAAVHTHLVMMRDAS